MARIPNRSFGIGKLRRTQLLQRVQEQQILDTQDDLEQASGSLNTTQTNVQDLNTAIIAVYTEFPELGELPPTIEP